MSPEYLATSAPILAEPLCVNGVGTASSPDRSTNNEFSWYALYTHSQFERKVETRLSDIGIVHYSPFIQRAKKPGQTRSHHKSPSPFERTEDPLLPGYVFALFNLNDRAQRHSVIATPGVVRIVGYGYDPEPIPDQEINSLRILVTSRVSISSIPMVTGGEYVRVIRGPLTGAEGYVVFVRAKAAQLPRIVVNLSMLGRSVSAEVGADCLEQITPPRMPNKAA